MSLRIVLLEDEPLIQEIIRAALLTIDPSIRIESFENGDEAIARYREAAPYDLVITDNAHPGLFGIEFIEAVRALQENQPVILQTGNTGQHIDEFERKWRDIPVFEKPWGGKQFLQAVKTLLTE